MRQLLLSLFFLISSLHSKELLLPIEGHISKETIEKLLLQIDETKADEIYITLNSSSGELNPTLALAKALGQLKKKSTLFIDENAIGPAAILPFVADEIYTSYYVSWGDISLGTDTTLPTNLLRNQVISLISPKKPNSDELIKLANAMVHSDEGEPLILNQNQMNERGLTKGTMNLEDFLAKFVPIREEITPAVNPESSSLPLDERLQDTILYKPDGENLVGYLKIDDRGGMISQGTWLYIHKALELFKKEKPAFVLLKINTPGGEVGAAQKISDALKELDTLHGIPVVAYIDNWAISAGAMVAYSCRFISIVKDAAMGAAEPIMAASTGESQTASEKVNSALRADFANRASYFGRNPNIAEAMVDKDIILVKRHGKIIKLSSDDEIQKKGIDPDVVISAKGKLLTLNAEQLMEFGVADILLPPQKLAPISEKEEEAGTWSFSKMLLSTYPFFAKIPDAKIQEYQMDWKTKFFSLLMSPVVASILFLGLMLGFYMELSTPGFGLAGSVGIICLLLIVLSSFALEIGGWLELVLLVAGLSLLLIDLFVLPSFGLLGTVGIIAFIIGLFGLMIPGLENFEFSFDTGTFNAAGQEVLARLAWLGGTLVVGIIIIGLLAKYVMPKFKPMQRLVLEGGQEGYTAGDAPETLPPIGSTGVVVSTLRPAGKIHVEDRMLDAMSTGEFLEKGTPIIIERIEGSRIFVREKL